MTDADGGTTTTASRFWLTNDLLAGFLILAFTGYVYMPLLTAIDGYPSTNPVVIAAFVTAFGVAVAWAFGQDAVEAWRGADEEA